MTPSDSAALTSQALIISTSLVTFISGFLLGVYSIRGYLISPALADERNRNLYDPLESEESDIDEDDTILDHAPNWSNGLEADRRQGLAASASSKATKKEFKKAADEKTKLVEPQNNEECKLVLVVRTDLGMTKGMFSHLVRSLNRPYNPRSILTPFTFSYLGTPISIDSKTRTNPR